MTELIEQARQNKILIQRIFSNKDLVEVLESKIQLWGYKRFEEVVNEYLETMPGSLRINSTNNTDLYHTISKIIIATNTLMRISESIGLAYETFINTNESKEIVDSFIDTLNKPHQFRKKPVVIEAMLYTGQNLEECLKWITTDTFMSEENKENFFISTLENNIEASVGDFIIKGVNGEFYPCKPDIFKKTYEIV